MADNTFIVGGGAGIIGLIVGFLAGGTDDGKLEKALTEKIEAGIESTTTASADGLSAMSDKIAGLEKALAAVTTAQSAATEAQSASDAKLSAALAAVTEAQAATDGKLDAAVKSLNDRIGTMSETLGKAVSDAGAEQTAKLQDALGSGMAKLEGSLTALALPTAPAADEGDAMAPEAPAEVEAEPEIEGITVGQTETLMDGKVRVFLSAVNDEDGTARVAVNGQDTMLIGSYHDGDFMIGEILCNVTLDAIVQGHVQMSAACTE